jgi:hypothetical protein
MGDGQQALHRLIFTPADVLLAGGDTVYIYNTVISLTLSLSRG